jgi:hypothetical protein
MEAVASPPAEAETAAGAAAASSAPSMEKITDLLQKIATSLQSRSVLKKPVKSKSKSKSKSSRSRPRPHSRQKSSAGRNKKARADAVAPPKKRRRPSKFSRITASDLAVAVEKVVTNRPPRIRPHDETTNTNMNEEDGSVIMDANETTATTAADADTDNNMATDEQQEQEPDADADSANPPAAAEASDESITTDQESAYYEAEFRRAVREKARIAKQYHSAHP